MYFGFSPGPQKGTIEDRMIAGMRLVLAASALLIIYFDPVEPDRLVPVTYAALVLYTIHSVVILTLVWRSAEFADRMRRWAHWVDVGSYAFLVALSSGTNSIFFFGFFFAIVISSFRSGYKTGLRVTIASAFLFTTISLATARLTPVLELNRFLLRPVDLAVLGYMISYWGGYHVKLSRRLALLKDVSRLSNPRFGFDRTIGSILEQLRAFFDADACLFISQDPNTNGFVLHRADRRDPNAATRSETMDPKLAEPLLRMGTDLTVVYRSSHSGSPWWQFRKGTNAAAKAKDGSDPEGQLAIEWLANLLDTGWLVSVPLRDHNKMLGRLYLAARSWPSFDHTDKEFLIQVSEHVMPVLENIRLADRLAAEAADRERQRIARDIHDSILQPYIGLQMGLAGVRRRLSLKDTETNGGAERLLQAFQDAAADTDLLIEMTADGIRDLRGYVTGLKSGNEDTLMPGLRRFAAKFTQATNILVQVRGDDGIQVDNRIASEIFQMIVEGLSNIRRHTQSQRGFIDLERTDGSVILRIENDGLSGVAIEPFTPRSIAERAESLGGRVKVQLFGEMGTSVIVEIPVTSA